MTPEELAERHPKLYHVTELGAHKTIQRIGLLSTVAILDLFEVDHHERAKFLTCRRPKAVPLKHNQFGTVVLNDNLPLSIKALEKHLDDDLRASDWLKILNGKVFFWPNESKIKKFGKKKDDDRSYEVIVFDTLALARAHIDTLCLSPINSGNTRHQTARRGYKTFSRAADYTIKEWSGLRRMKKPDRIKEITVDGCVPRAGDYIDRVDTIHTDR